jgi:tetratricopeptide (TPR) repeat protein
MAYASLGTAYHNLGEKNLAAENTKKSYELRERVSEREKYYIESHYHHFVTGNLEEARKVYELWAQAYPRELVPPANLGVLYQSLGQYDKALEEFREALRLAPDDALTYGNLVISYIYLNRLKQAQATAEEAQAKNLDSADLHLYLYEMDFLQHDAARLAQQVKWSMGKPGQESLLLYFEANTAAYSGQLNKSERLFRQAASAERAGEKDRAAGAKATAAWSEALFGNAAEARQLATAATAQSTGKDGQYVAALALSMATLPGFKGLWKIWPSVSPRIRLYNSIICPRFAPSLRSTGMTSQRLPKRCKLPLHTNWVSPAVPHSRPICILSMCEGKCI